IPNCVFIFNRYHQEFKNHGNQVKALARVIQRIGSATCIANTTTANGLSTCIFTHGAILKDFGEIASMNILVAFMLSMIIIPSILSFLPPPIQRHTQHLDRKSLDKAIALLVNIVTNHRKKVYLSVVVVVIVAAYGISKVTATGNIVDDLPDDDQI